MTQDSVWDDLGGLRQELGELADLTSTERQSHLARLAAVDPQRAELLDGLLQDVDSSDAQAVEDSERSASDTALNFERAFRIAREIESLPPEDVHRRVEDLREDAPAVAKALDSILASASEAGFTETRPLPRSSLEKQIIGRYRILRRLGEGGMGIVYEAEQDQPRRRVALKVLRPSFVNEDTLKRFAHEAQILGRLTHPGIAQVFDAGTYDSGEGAQPFFAMELVRGVDLSSWAKAEEPSLEDRVDLMARICDAVHHAHQKGVVHRDLKPDNILVDAGGDPKVLDFGIARITDADLQLTTMRTGTGKLLGTPAYMSPEQARGDAASLDATSDIYTLGTILFELLSGELPLAIHGRPLHAAVVSIQQDEPTRLVLAESGAFAIDLDTILRQCLEKEPEQRYPSAAALALDLRRAVRHEPIAARRPSSLHVLRKFVRRHRGLSLGLATAALTLIAGIAVSTTLLLQARAANLEAQAATARAEREADLAIATREFVLGDMLKAASPGELGAQVTVVEALQRATERVDPTLGRFPETAAAVRGILGSAMGKLGLGLESQTLLELAWEEHAELLGPDDPRTIETRRRLALQLVSMSEDRSARPHLEALAQRPAGTLDPVDELEIKVMLAAADARAGDATGVDRVTLLMADAADLDPTDDDILDLRLHFVGILYQARRLDEALREAEAILGFIDRDPAHPRYPRIEQRVSSILFRMGRLDEGRARLNRCRARLREVHGADNLDVTKALAEYGSMLSDVDELEAAEETFGDALAEYERLVGIDHPFALQVRNNLAIVYRKQNRHVEAEETVRSVIDARRGLFGEDAWQVAQSLDVLGVVLGQTSRLDEALKIFQQAETIYVDALGERHWNTLSVRYNLAWAYGELELWGEALSVYESLVGPLRATYGDEHSSVADALYQVARMEIKLGRYDAAEPPAGAALEIRRVAESTPDQLADSEAQFGQVLARLGRIDEAEPYLFAARDRYAAAGIELTGYFGVTEGLQLVEEARAAAAPEPEPESE